MADHICTKKHCTNVFGYNPKIKNSKQMQEIRHLMTIKVLCKSYRAARGLVSNQRGHFRKRTRWAGLSQMDEMVDDLCEEYGIRIPLT
jgi:hypothetical protein